MIGLGSTFVGMLFLFAGGVLALAIYFLPFIIAASRKHHNALAIFMLNLFLGWTFLGWVIALIWACTAVQGQYSASRNRY